MLNIIKSPMLKKIAHQSFWYVFANVLIKMSALIVTWYCAKQLSELNFGRFALIQGSLIAFQVFAVMGLEVTATKLIASCENISELKNTQKSVWTAWFLFAIITALSVFFASDYIAVDYLNDPELSFYIKLVAIIVVLFSFKTVATGILLGLEDTKAISKSNAISVFIGISVSFLLISELKLTGAILGLLSIELISSCVIGYICYKKNCITWRFFDNKLNDIKKVLSFTLPLSFSGMLVMPVNFYLLKEVALNSGYLDVGIINILNQWQAILIFLPLNISTVMLPLLVKKNTSLNRNSLMFLGKTIFWFISVSIFMLTFFILFSDFLFDLYGHVYSSAIDTEILLAMALCVLILIISNQFNNYFLSINKVWLLVTGNVVWSCSVVILFYYLNSITSPIIAIFLARALSYLIKMTFMFVYIYFKRRNTYEFTT